MIDESLTVKCDVCGHAKAGLRESAVVRAAQERGKVSGIHIGVTLFVHEEGHGTPTYSTMDSADVCDICAAMLAHAARSYMETVKESPQDA